MKLINFLRAATPEERAKVAKACNTTVEYLYNLAGGHRFASPELATDIEAQTVKAAKRHPDRLEKVSRASLVKNPRIFAGVAA